MAVIGIISNSNNIIEKENEIKREINQKNIIIISEEALNNIKNIKFDIIIIFEEMTKIEKVKKIIKESKYVVINTDFKENLKLLDEDIEGFVITFGFNQKATITIISNENEEIILELQREITNLEGKKIECQEIKLERKYGKKRLYEEISMKILTILAKI